VTDCDGEELKELPRAFLATTVKLRGVPLLKCWRVAVRTFPTATGLPLDGVTIYPVIGEPPLEAGALQETIAEFNPATAATPVGAPGMACVDILPSVYIKNVEQCFYRKLYTYTFY
jgi:hypothetical protein